MFKLAAKKQKETVSFRTIENESCIFKANDISWIKVKAHQSKNSNEIQNRLIISDHSTSQVQVHFLESLEYCYQVKEMIQKIWDTSKREDKQIEFTTSDGEDCVFLQSQICWTKVKKEVKGNKEINRLIISDTSCEQVQVHYIDEDSECEFILQEIWEQ